MRGEGEGPERVDQIAMLSISHDGDYATATCLAYYEEKNGGQEEGRASSTSGKDTDLYSNGVDDEGGPLFSG